MSILVTGDTHGDLRRFSNQNIKGNNNDEFPSHIIIVGDFGLIWSNKPEGSPEEQYWLKWLDEKPYETLVLLGNHENYERIYAKPIVKRYGGPMFQLSEKVFVFQHGNIYTIEGKTFFCFGGALSIDKYRRQDRISWWAEEIPTTADVMLGLMTLDSVQGKVDYVLTHTVPKEAIRKLDESGLLPFGGSEDPKFADPTVPMLEALRDKLDPAHPKKWFYGHFHNTITVRGDETGREYSLLYASFARIE
jgi:predicted phosphodiesterase